MTVEAAPKAVESARPRIEGAKVDRLKAGGGQGAGGGEGDFAGLLSLSVAVEDPAEPGLDTAATTTPTGQPVDQPPLDLGAMLALLVGVPTSPTSSGQAGATVSMVITPGADGPGDAAGVSGANGIQADPTLATLWAAGASERVPPNLSALASMPEDTGDMKLVDLEQNRFGKPGSVLPNGVRVGARSSWAAGVKSVAGRADALVPDPAAGGKLGSALPLLTSPGVDRAAAAVAVPEEKTNQTSAALAALLAGGKGDWRGDVRLNAHTSESVAASLITTMAGLESAGRPPGNSSDKAAELTGKLPMEGLNPAASPAADSARSLPAASGTPALQISDAMLADTVSYWVAQGVQSAELTLNGFGGEPIQVSIQLANGEAQIGFRSDQPETRQVIESAMAQLKDALASQGLVLAGVSVGTSSRQDGNPGESPRRPGGRLRGISLADTAPARSASDQNPSAGQRLDLFV